MIELRSLSKNNVSPFYEWINDDEVIKYSLPLFLNISTENEIDKWYKELIENSEIINLGIFLKTTDELIGYAGICDISEINKSGDPTSDYSNEPLPNGNRINIGAFGNTSTASKSN